MPSVEKEQMYQEVVDRTKDKMVFFSGFNGLSVEEIQSFRRSIRQASTGCFVVKKTLIKRYFSDLGFDDIESFLENNVVVTTVEEEPQKLSKALVNFQKDFDEKFAVKGAYIDGEMKDKSYVINLSKLPSKEELIAKLLGSMNAPMTNFVMTLKEVTRQFTVVLNEVKKQKEQNS